MPTDINATDLEEETTATLGGTEQFVMFDAAQGKRSSLNNILQYFMNQGIAFTSDDVQDGDASAWTSVTPVASGNIFSVLFNRISTMMKNVRFLYGLLGTTDISGIGGGTVTGAISTLNSKTTFSIAFTNGTSTSVSANSTAWLSAPLPTGKTAIALVGYYLNGGSACSVYNMTMGDTGASVAVRNNSASAASVTLTAYYLCIG